MGTPCEDRLQRRFLEFFSNDDAVSRVRHDYFKTATFHKKQTFLQRSYFPGVTNSTQQLLSWSSYFFRAATFSENSLLLSSYFLKIATYFERKFYGPATFCEYVVIQGSQLFREQLLFRKKIFFEYQYLQRSFFFEASTSTKHQIFLKKKII